MHGEYHLGWELINAWRIPAIGGELMNAWRIPSRRGIDKCMENTT